MQGVHLAMPMRVRGHLGGVAQHHRQALVVWAQLEPSAAGRYHLRVEFDGGGAHAQHLVAIFGQGRSAQAQLHGVQIGHFLGRHEEQPGLHALHIFQLDAVGLADVHRALHPLAAQVQVAHLAVLGHVDLRMGLLGGHAGLSLVAHWR